MEPRLVSTFSIVARDAASGDLGVAVQSRRFNVGAVVPWAEAGVGAVATRPAEGTITSTIVQMARALNLTTIAEGVETTEQMQLLASYGCNRMQGHLFSPAIEPELLERLLSAPPFWWMRPGGHSSTSST